MRYHCNKLITCIKNILNEIFDVITPQSLHTGHFGVILHNRTVHTVVLVQELHMDYTTNVFLMNYFVISTYGLHCRNCFLNYFCNAFYANGIVIVPLA